MDTQRHEICDDLQDEGANRFCTKMLLMDIQSILQTILFGGYICEFITFITLRIYSWKQFSKYWMVRVA